MMIRENKNRTLNMTKVNFIVDIVILVLFLADLHPSNTGLTLHEWLGLLLATLFMAHVLLHWSWVVETTGRIFGKVAQQARINYILNIALLIAMTLVIGSGIMISQAVLPFFGLSGERGGFWRMLHGLSADAVIWIVALHIALHWSWIASTFSRYVVRIFWRPVSAGTVQPSVSNE
jgi:cytochrome b